MLYNAPAIAPFRDAVRKAGVYTQLRAGYSDESWRIMEKATGLST
jgi:hypothetical protein